MLTASLELGVRHDGGDAETGFGADIGTSLALAAPPRELSAELRACGLLAQEADSLSRRGLSGTLAIDPAPDSERGLSLSLSQTVGGPASGGAGALLERPTLAGLGAETEEARLGYPARNSAASTARWVICSASNSCAATAAAGSETCTSAGSPISTTLA